MARTILRVHQTQDGDFIEELELLSDGTISQSGPFSVVSITSGTQTIIVSNGTFLDDFVNAGDIIVISSGNPADGTYTVNTVVDNNTLTVVEAIVNGGAVGQAETFYPPADEKIGIQDPGGAYSHTGIYQTLDDHIQDGEAHFSESEHEDLDTLVHNLSEDMYEEFIYTGSRVDSIIVWTDSGKTTKIRETNFTYTGQKVTTEVIKQYDSGGTLKVTLTGTYSYTGNKLDDITWVEV